MSKRKIIIIEHGAYFYTARICGGKTIFRDHEFADIVLGSLKWLRENKRMLLYAFVVMPNHVHFLFQPCSIYSTEQIAHDFGSYTAHAVVEKIKLKNNTELLTIFREAGRKKKDRDNSVWENTLVITVDTARHFMKKKEYIHNNPVNKSWLLCEERSRYRYSSACYYDKDVEPIIPIDDITRTGGSSVGSPASKCTT